MCHWRKRQERRRREERGEREYSVRTTNGIHCLLAHQEAVFHEHTDSDLISEPNAPHHKVTTPRTTI